MRIAGRQLNSIHIATNTATTYRAYRLPTPHYTCLLGDPHAARYLQDAVRGNVPQPDWLANLFALSEPSLVFVPKRISPADGIKFLCHRLLTVAPFEDEVFLLNQDLSPSTLHAIGLSDAQHALRTFVLQELAYWPVTYKAMWKNINSSWDFLRRLLTTGHTPLFNLRIPVTDVQLAGMRDVQCQNMVSAYHSGHQEMLHTLPCWSQAADQSNPSWMEQQEGFAIIKDRIDVILAQLDLSTNHSVVRCLYITGPPGCGKTHLMLQSMRYFYEQCCDITRRYSSACGVITYCKTALTHSKPLPLTHSSTTCSITCHQLPTKNT